MQTAIRLIRCDLGCVVAGPVAVVLVMQGAVNVGHVVCAQERGWELMIWMNVGCLRSSKARMMCQLTFCLVSNI